VGVLVILECLNCKVQFTTDSAEYTTRCDCGNVNVSHTSRGLHVSVGDFYKFKSSQEGEKCKDESCDKKYEKNDAKDAKNVFIESFTYILQRKKEAIDNLPQSHRFCPATNTDMYDLYSLLIDVFRSF
jgi:hypothetical protein